MNKNMRVLYIANSTSVSGGDNKSLLTLLSYVMQEGIEPMVVVPDKDGIYESLRNKGIRVFVVDYRMDIYPNFSTIKDKFLFLPRLVARRFIEFYAERKISTICEDMKIDLIHSNVSVLSCGLRAARKCGLPHVAHVREYVDIDFHIHPYPNMKSFLKRLNGNGSYLICITRGIQEHHGFVGRNVKQIYNGINIEVLDNNSVLFDEEYFFYAGRIEQAKGVLHLIEAYSSFIDIYPNGPSLKLAGQINDSVYYSKIMNFISLKGLEDKISFLGSRKDVQVLMKNALATIVPSFFEAFGRCLPEAMLNGCLTIGHDTGGTKEQYDNGLNECGLEIGLRYKNKAELTCRLEEVFKYGHTERFTEMRNRAKDVVRKLYSPKQYVEGVCSFYRQILNNNLSR